MRDVSTPHRAGDDDDTDYRGQRRPIDGSEVRIGYGNKSVSLRGGMTIGVVLGIVILIGLGYVIREVDRMRMEIPGNMAEQHRILARTLDTATRYQTCVLALTADERVAWRSSREPRAWLVAMCPGLLLQATEPVTP